MAPEQPATIDRILVVQILSNLQFFTKVPKSRILPQYQFLLHLVFLTFKENMLQFLSIKSWIDQAALTQHHIFYLSITAEVASAKRG